MILLLALSLAAAPGASALERLAHDTLKPLDGAFEGPIGVYVEGSPAPASRAFASLLVAQLAERRLGPAPVEARDASEAERLARHLGLRSLLRVTLQYEAPRVVTRGDVLSTWVNFWAGETPTRTGPAAVITASVDADLEAITLLGPAPVPAAPARALELNLGVLTRAAEWPAAIAVADLDGDKKAELLALFDGALWCWAGDGKLKHRVELQSAPALRPTREPFGVLSVAAGRVLAWNARRDRPEWFSWQRDGLRSQGPAEHLQAGPITLTPRPGTPSFAREFTWAGKQILWPEPLQTLGLAGPIALGIGPAGQAAIARGQAPSTFASGVGAGSTLGDLDGDGTPEVVVTTARSTGDGDEVRVLSLGAFEAVQARGGNVNEAVALWTRKLEGRVVVAAAGDLDGDGAEEVVLGAWLSDGTSELFVVRRSP